MKRKKLIISRKNLKKSLKEKPWYIKEIPLYLIHKQENNSKAKIDGSTEKQEYGINSCSINKLKGVSENNIYCYGVAFQGKLVAISKEIEGI